MKSFKRTTNAFVYVFEYEFNGTEPDNTIYIKMPVVSPSKRGFNDIGWQTDGDVTLYGTLSSNPKSEDALWQKIRENEDINKTICAVKAVNEGGHCKLVMRALLN